MMPFRRLWLNVGQNGVNLNRLFRNISETIDKYMYWIKFDSINSFSWSRVSSVGCTSEMCTRLSRFAEPRLSLAVQVMACVGSVDIDRDDSLMTIKSIPTPWTTTIQTDKWTGRENRKDMVLLCSLFRFYASSESGTTLVPPTIWRIDVHARLYFTITGDRYLWDYYISSPHSEWIIVRICVYI